MTLMTEDAAKCEDALDLAAVAARHRMVAVRWRGTWTGEMYELGYLSAEDDSKIVIRQFVMQRKTDGSWTLGGSSTTIERAQILELQELALAGAC